MGKLVSADLRNLEIGLQITANDVAEISGLNRVKGIHPFVKDGKRGVFILCTIGGENYSNSWLDKENTRLKYYLEARTDTKTGKRIYNRSIKTNSSIIKSRTEGYPVLVFLRYKKGDPFRFEGEFQFERTVVEPTGDEYFELTRSPQEEITLPELLETQLYSDLISDEGKKVIKSHMARERNPKIIKAAIQREKQLHGKVVCQVCGFDFEATYGVHGKDFIEGHHKLPLSESGDRGVQTRVEDIALLCSNCHRMIHRKKEWLAVEQLKDMLMNKK